MEFNKQNIRSKIDTTETHVIDEGLRAYMLRVYNYMALGTVITGITAWVTANTSLINLFYSITLILQFIIQF